MPPTVVVAIREDPRSTARPVEALRVALGLATGENPLTVLLLGEAPRLLAGDEEDLQDGEILEKYLPSLRQMGIAFVVPSGAVAAFDLDPTAYSIREAQEAELARLLASADRAIVF